MSGQWEQPLAEALGCRPGWCVWTSGEMARMPDLRAGGGGERAVSSGPLPPGVLD